MVHLVNLLFQLPFVQWFEFIDVGFTSLCKMCTNLGKEGQMAVASVWAELEPKWLQDRVGMIQQVIVDQFLLTNASFLRCYYLKVLILCGICILFSAARIVKVCSKCELQISSSFYKLSPRNEVIKSD